MDHEQPVTSLHRLALIDMQGEHGSGIVEGWSVMRSPPPGRPKEEFELDLVFAVPEIAVDERLRDPHALFHALRIGPDTAPACFSQANAVEDLGLDDTTIVVYCT